MNDEPQAAALPQQPMAATTQQPPLSQPQQQHVDSVAVKPPPFWKAEPLLWFYQVEAQFELARISSDSTKYNHVLSAVDTDILAQVADFIRNPPATGKYEGIKQRLINTFSDSNEKKLKRLLSDIELGDRKPSQLLNEMMRLGGSSVTEQMLKTLWMARLPAVIQSVLTTSTDTLPKLAAMADKIADIDQSQTYAVTNSTAAVVTSDMLSDITRQIAELRTELRSTRSRSKSRSRFPHRSSTPSRIDAEERCWYHRKFREKAKKCCAPCKFLSHKSDAAGN